MPNLGKIRVGDLGTVIDILFQDTSYQDVNAALDLTNALSISITVTDPDGFVVGTFNMVKVNPPGTDGLATYVTNQIVSLWTKPGFWHWFGTATFAGNKISTLDAIREVLE
jgi:hypothetical protein